MYRFKEMNTRGGVEGRRAFFSALLLTLLFVPAVAAADVEVLATDSNGLPSFVTGDLGTVDAAANVQLKGGDEALFALSAKNALLGVLAEHFGAGGGEDMQVVRIKRDEIGKVHVRFQEYLNGLVVVGAQMYLHADAATGEVYAVNGELAPDAGVPAPVTAKGSAAAGLLLAASGAGGEVVGEPELLYFHDAETGRTHLSWKVRVRGVEDGMVFDDDVYLDASSFEIVAVDGHVKTVRHRRTYDATGSEVNDDGSVTGLPGVLVCDERNTACGDPTAQRAHAGAAAVYDYYRTRFGRDSLDGHGMVLSSSVHVGHELANAFWYGGRQMLFGDGDGVWFRDLTRSFDVIAHEYTHGVTDFESNLIYQKQSGALNEALSDIFGVAADSFRRGGVVDAATWKLGEAAFTPQIPGDAVRYLNDPEADGFSRSYFPERLFRGACTPSRDNDRCGVHSNSGIANLAFYLMVEGGRHPRGKTSIRVRAIGMAKAEQIFYRAQTSCLTSGATFLAARYCTARAAQELFGAGTQIAVEAAWEAVGVRGDGGGASEGLSNGTARRNLSGTAGGRRSFFIEVPEGATGLSFRLSGGSGDPDLYVQRGSQPTTSSYDCRSRSFGTSELCRIPSPQAGTYYVLVYGYSAYSGVRLMAKFEEPAP